MAARTWKSRPVAFPILEFFFQQKILLLTEIIPFSISASFWFQTGLSGDGVAVSVYLEHKACHGFVQGDT